MRSKIRCPACRKGVAVSPADAGMAVVCLACGHSFTAPSGIVSAAEAAVPPVAGSVHKPAGATPPKRAPDAEVAAAAPRVVPTSDDPAPLPPPAPALPATETATAAAPTPPGDADAVSGEGQRGRRSASWIGWGLAAVLAVVWLGQYLVGTREAPQPAPNQFADGAVTSAPATGPTEVSRRRAKVETPESPPSGNLIASPQLVDPPGASPSESAGAAAVSKAGDKPPADEAADPPAHEPPPPPLAETRPAAPADPPRASAEMPRPATAPAWRPVRRRRGPLQPLPATSDGEVTDEQIEAAIRRAVDYLLGHFDDEGQLTVAGGNSGMQFLATYALIQAGLTIKDARLDPRGERVATLLERTKRLPVWPHQSTYHRSVRAAALALLNRPQDRKTLGEDVRRLVTGHTDGGYTYSLDDEPSSSRNRRRIGGGSPDNSNAQYGLLGVWSGAEAGVEVPGNYWEAVNKYWTDGQLADGSWPYSPGGSGFGRNGYVSMAAAGTASLFVTYDQLSRRSATLGRDPFPPALERALRWWETNEDWLAREDPRSPFGQTYWGYQLYGIERVGLASGFKYFGKHDWYRVLARQAVEAQAEDGSWQDGRVIDTAYVLLFLARGRAPILMNKLRYDGFWANRPRDLANLARFATHSTERPLNWQIVDVRTEWHDWLDAPILYVAGHVAPDFSNEERVKLRNYALAGGMIFTHADGARPAFDAYATELAGQLFPEYELADVPPDHPVYNVVAKVDPKPRLRAVTNGSRVLLLHSPTDLSQAWQTRDEKRRAEHFELGLNLFLYAAGKRDLRNRLDSPYVPPATAEEEGAASQPPLRVARLSYGGHWNPEPGAWSRFARLFLRRTGTVLEPVTVPWAELTLDAAPFAHLTGTARYEPTPVELAALRAYVEGGGVLLVDNCGGAGAFAVHLKAVLGEAFPQAVLDPVRAREPFLKRGEPGMVDVTRPRYRPFASARQGNRPGLYGFRAGDGAVLLTTLDVTSGLLHTGTWGIYGFDPDYCESLVQNLILWSHDTRPE